MSFFRSLLWVVSVASAFTKSFRSSSHLLAGLPALLLVLVDLSSPGFHSAAFLLHRSLLCVAFRRACRHLSFYFVPFFLCETKKSPPTRRPKTKKERSAPRWRLSRETNQVSMAFTTVLSRSAAEVRARRCVSMYLSASFVHLFTYSIQSSRLCSWLVVFSSSSSNENLLSWSHSLRVLISSSNLFADFVVTHVFYSIFALVFLYFLVRLCDDTKHSALSGAEHSFSSSFAVSQVP